MTLDSIQAEIDRINLVAKAHGLLKHSKTVGRSTYECVQDDCDGVNHYYVNYVRAHAH